MEPRLRALSAARAGRAALSALAAQNWPPAASLAVAARAAQLFSGDAYILAADCEAQSGRPAQALELYRAAALRGNGLAALRRVEGLPAITGEVSASQALQHSR